MRIQLRALTYPGIGSGSWAIPPPPLSASIFLPQPDDGRLILRLVSPVNPRCRAGRRGCLGGGPVRMVGSVVKIAADSNPVRRPVPAFMLRASLDDVEGGDSYEQLWARRVGEDRFEVCCVPFFAYDLALGDIVRADAGTDMWFSPWSRGRETALSASRSGVARTSRRCTCACMTCSGSRSTCTSGSRRAMLPSAWSRGDHMRSSSRAWLAWARPWKLSAS